MRIAIPKEIHPGEKRVAATPQTVLRLRKLGFEVVASYNEFTFQICRKGNIDPPEWHGSVLKDRQKACNEGKIAASDWQQAKKTIKKNLGCE